jgi:hypothetical protein
MGIIHSNKYSGFSTANFYDDPDLAALGIPKPDIGIITPVWNYDFNPPGNYEFLHVPSTPDYREVDVAPEDQTTVGSSTEFRRHKSHISPTGSPYLYNTGDTFTELKPIKSHWAWRNGEYGHGSYYSNHNDAFLGLFLYSTGNLSMAHSQNGYTDDIFEKFGQYTSPHWMLGFSLAQSGSYIIAGHPHSCGSGSTTTTEPNGIGGFKQIQVNGPYAHLDPDKSEYMMNQMGLGNPDEGNIRFSYPNDGMLSIEYATVFNFKKQKISKVVRSSYLGNSSSTGRTTVNREHPPDCCINNIFGPYYPSYAYDPPTILNDIAGWTTFSTTTSYPSYSSKVWPEACAAILPPSLDQVTRIVAGVAKTDSTQHFRKEWWGPAGQSWSHPQATFVGFHTDLSGNYQAQFGYSIDMADGFFIGGAPGYYGGVNQSRKDRGGIAVFIRNPNGSEDHQLIYDGDTYHSVSNWVPYSRREGENPGDRFGHAVACGYNRFVVGAPGFNSGQGKAYLYADVWREHEAGPTSDILPENDPTLHHGSWIYSKPATAARGSAVGIASGQSFCKHAQRLYGLKLIKELTPVGVGQSYGYAVSVGNGRIAVSNLADAGSVEIFNLEGNRIGILTAPDGQPGDCFGRSVDIRQGIIAVGAPHASVGIGTTSVRCGAVYAFDRNRVSSIHQIWRGRNKDSEGNSIRPDYLWKQHPPDGADGDRFGDSLDVGSGRVLVGAPYKSHFETPSADGSAYCFNLHGNLLNILTAASWKERNSGYLGPGIRTDSHFGHAVSISGHNAVISAPFHGEWIDCSAWAKQDGWNTNVYNDEARDIEHPAVPDNLFFFTTPQCITVWDIIDNNYGKQ